MHQDQNSKRQLGAKMDNTKPYFIKAEIGYRLNHTVSSSLEKLVASGYCGLNKAQAKSFLKNLAIIKSRQYDVVFGMAEITDEERKLFYVE